MARADIHVRNRSYSIACAPGQEQRLATLAGRLDRRVAAIAQAVGDVGEERLYLIAALSMLDELETAAVPQAAPAGNGPGGEARAAAALVDAAARIEAIAQRAEARNRRA